ncbi:MAG TPA: SAM-dependent methyltransferase [Amycolatopsis sp.]|nr:SAM-dependent methyltransferase [Amycolatopsis sp.]
MTTGANDPPYETRPLSPKAATAAGVYDWMLGGSTHTDDDARVAGQLLGAMPMIARTMRYNREFLQRGVRFLCQAGIRQFLDLGSGVPTVGNVHEIAQHEAPGARVVYVDYNQPAVDKGRELLAGNPDATCIQADLREPARIFAHPEVRALLDLDQPVALLMIAVLHFIGDDEHPGDLVESYTRRLSPGSYLALTHGARIDDASRLRAQQTVAVAAYDYGVFERTFVRSAEEIRTLFGAAELVEPGLVYLPDWRPADPGYTPDDEDESRIVGMGGIARLD